MRKLKKNNLSYKISKYLPVFIILLSLSIIIGSTFAYFTDRVERTSELTFSKVELSGETTTGINGKLRDVIPGTPLVDGALKFSKSIDSEAIYVRAKISFSLPTEYKDDNDMKEMVDLLRSATDFNIVSEAQHGAVWSAKDGNYFYLVSSADATKLMRVDTIDTYVLSEEVVVPRDLENLPDNAQYMKSINFHVAFEAIQADNVSSVLSETKETFNVLFPENEAEKYVDNGNNDDNGDNEEDDTVKVSVTFKGFDGESDTEVEINVGEVVNEPEVDMPVDENGTSTHAIVGWYTDSEFTNAFEFGNVVEESLTLYPNVLEVSQGLEFADVKENRVVVGLGVSKGTCEDNFIVVPSTYMGQPVTHVANVGFRDLTNLENIYLPNTITTIGSSAFRGCSNLALTSLPTSLTSIGSWAFHNCTSLALTSLPEGITSLVNYVFPGCTSLALTSLPSGLTSIGVEVFSNCTSLALTSLPTGITRVGGSAFKGCSTSSNDCVNYLPIEGTDNNVVLSVKSTAITSVEWPENVTLLADYAFQNCSKLAITSLPDGLINIGNHTFERCTSLALTSLPAGITYVGEYAFYECKSLALTSLPAGLISIGMYAFRTCTTLTSISLPAGLTSIDGWVFVDCTNLTLISLPKELTSVGNSIFDNCTKLNYILCESDEVANLASGKGRDNTYIYSLQESGYDATGETEVVISDSVTIYTNTIDGVKWVRTSDNRYFKCIA